MPDRPSPTQPPGETAAAAPRPAAARRGPLGSRALRDAAALEPVLVVGYLLAVAVICLQMALARPLWYDELFTLQLARFGSLRELFANIAAGVDLQPPLLFVLVHASTAVFGDAEWAVRLPSIVSVPLALALLHAFVRRRRGAGEAAIAIAGVAASGGVLPLVVEARPYGLVFLFASLALVAWQRAAEGGPRRARWWVALGAAFSLGMASHYYFCVLVAALGAGEAVRWARQRKVDLAAVAAFAAPVLTLLAEAPLWSPGRSIYVAGFWSKPAADLASVRAAYNGLFTDDASVAVAFALAASAILGALSAAREADRDAYPIWETSAIVAVAATPAVGVVLGATLAGGYYFRYTAFAVLGLSTLLALACGRVAGARWHGVVAAAGLVVLGATGRSREVVRQYEQRAGEISATAELLAAQAAGATVIVESGDMFMQLAHYHRGAPARAVYLADPDRSARYTQVDAVDRGLLILDRITPYPVMRWDALWAEVASGKPVFYLGRLDKWQWQWQELRDRGARMERLTTAPARAVLFRVTGG